MDEELNFCPASKWSCHMSCEGWQHPVYFIFHPSLLRTHLSAQSAVIIRVSHCWSWRHQTRQLLTLLRLNHSMWNENQRRGVVQKLQSRCWSLTLPSPLGLSSLWMLFNSHFFSAPTVILKAYQMNRTQSPGLFCFSDLFSVSINRSLCPDGAGSEASTCQACLLRSEASH